MKDQRIVLNSEQLAKTIVLANPLSNNSVSTSLINLGFGIKSTFKFGVKPLGTSLPKNESRKEFKPPVKIVKISDYLPKEK